MKWALWLEFKDGSENGKWYLRDGEPLTFSNRAAADFDYQFKTEWWGKTARYEVREYRGG